MITITYKTAMKVIEKSFTKFDGARDFLEQLESDQCSHCEDTGQVTDGQDDDIITKRCPFCNAKEVEND